MHPACPEVVVPGAVLLFRKSLCFCSPTDLPVVSRPPQGEIKTPPPWSLSNMRACRLEDTRRHIAGNAGIRHCNGHCSVSNTQKAFVLVWVEEEHHHIASQGLLQWSVVGVFIHCSFSMLQVSLLSRPQGLEGFGVNPQWLYSDYQWLTKYSNIDQSRNKWNK